MSDRSSAGRPVVDHVTAVCIVSLVAKIFWLPGCMLGYLLSLMFPDYSLALFAGAPILGPMVAGAVLGMLSATGFIAQTYSTVLHVEMERRRTERLKQAA